MVRATNAKNEVLEKLTYDKDYSNRLNTQKKENEVLHKRTLEYKSERHQTQRDFEDKLRENTLKRKPFDAKINEKSKQDATAYKMRQTAAAQRHQAHDYGMEDSPGAAEMDAFDHGDDHYADDIEAKMREEEL